jgi:putative chitinase
MSAIKPTSQTELIVDEFIKYANQHLTTVSGVINTISVYPPASTPGPGIILWNGYFVPPSIPTPKLPDDVVEIDTSAFEMADEQKFISDQHTLNGQRISASTSAGFSGYSEPSTSKYRTLDEAVQDSTISIPPPIDGIAQIPNYKTNLKVPPELVLAMRRFGVGKTPIERAHFLAQVAHESMNFFYKEEIASGRAYEGRRDLGNIYPGDGMRFKGRGYIQLTGRENYTRFGKMVGSDLVANPLLAATKHYADIPCLFWKVNGIYAYARNSSAAALEKVTRKINGGTNGINDRAAKFNKYWIELQRDPTLWT